MVNRLKGEANCLILLLYMVVRKAVAGNSSHWGEAVCRQKESAEEESDAKEA